jgi:precorrin-3B synthase
VDRVIALARWFAATRGGAGRMARHPALAEAEGNEPPAPAGALPGPAMSALGPVVGVAFGQMEAAALARLVTESGAVAVRVTPERGLVLEGGQAVPADGFLGVPDPVLGADACAGAPFCQAATVATRALARRLAGRVAGLHVSGCAKGCARARPAAVTLVGRAGAFDLVRNGAAWDAPERTGLAERELLEMFGAQNASV